MTLSIFQCFKVLLNLLLQTFSVVHYVYGYFLLDICEIKHYVKNFL